MNRSTTRAALVPDLESYQALSGFVGVALALLVLTFVGQWAVEYTRLRLKMRRNGIPSINSAVGIFDQVIRPLYPHIPYLSPMRQLAFDRPFRKYENARSDLIALGQASTPSRLVYATGSPATVRAIAAATDVFHKPAGSPRYRVGNVFGLQLISAQNGAEHERHRRVVRACFSEGFMQYGWDSMAHMWRVMLREEGLETEQAGDTRVLHDPGEILVKMTLSVVGASWFAVDIPWREPAQETGPIMPFADALHIFSGTVPAQLLLPRWFMDYNPFPYMRRLGKAQRSLVHHIKAEKATAEQKHKARLASGAPQEEKKYKDLFGALVAAKIDQETGTKDQPPQEGLSDSEIVGNIFSFVMAGHESTAHTLAFALALLGPRPDLQEQMHAEVQRALLLPAEGRDGSPGRLVYKDMSRLPLLLATAYEALRMKDIAMHFSRIATRDTTLPYTTWEDDKNGRPVPRERLAHIAAGAWVHMDLAACGLNPFVWPEPESFDPSRHLRETEVVGADGRPDKKVSVSFENQVGFLLGARQCIGKRFAEVEMVSFLAHTVLHYRWEVVKRPGETQAQADKRASTGREWLTFTPPNFDLRLIRR
ncbi:hypothetical protein Brms1b_013666 [Colletotrichum noveboracense]|nr:hypothetical protein Brms1b_013666 [Colletotrichum noveboracense]